MAATAEAPTTRTAPTDEEIAEAYKWAMTHAEREAPRPYDLAEFIQHQATLAVLWAREHYTAAAGEFGPFARSVIRRAVRHKVQNWRRLHGNRPRHVSLSGLDDPDEYRHPVELVADRAPQGPGELNLPLAIRELPADLRDAVRFFYVDRFDVRECAMLLGVAPETVRARLLAAARMLDPDAVKPPRRAGENRLTR